MQRVFSLKIKCIERSEFQIETKCIGHSDYTRWFLYFFSVECNVLWKWNFNEIPKYKRETVKFILNDSVVDCVKVVCFLSSGNERVAIFGIVCIAMSKHIYMHSSDGIWKVVLIKWRNRPCILFLVNPMIAPDGSVQIRVMKHTRWNIYNIHIINTEC